MKLYELQAEMQNIEDAMDEWAMTHEGDISEFPLTDRMNEIEKAVNEKALNIGAWIKNLIAEEKTLKEEAKNLQARAKARNNKVEGLKRYLSCLIPEGQKFENTQCKISWRKSESVNITCNVDLLPEEFQKLKIEPDKAGLKKALKEGKEIPAVGLETKQNIQIK